MRDRMRRHFTTIALGLMIALSIANVLLAVQRERQDRATRVPADMAKVWQAYEALQRRYVNQDALDPAKLADGAIRGMVQALEDPFAAYLDEAHYQRQVETNLEGKFEGIGAIVGIHDGHVTITATLPGSPAESAGLLPGDIIVKVAGQSVEGLTIYEVVQRIRGPKDTPITITVQSAKAGVQQDLTITRTSLQLPTITSRLLEDAIGYVRIAQFAPQTKAELDSALLDLQQGSAKAIVLDLRSNLGGLLTAVVAVAGQFLDGGLVLSEVNGDGKRTELFATKGGLYTQGPLVVLVNQFSASGAEVVAGAVQARQRGLLVGTRTLGKDVVNIPIKLSDGSGLYLPTAMWYTPAGNAIGDGGLTPDVEVQRTMDDLYTGADPQLDRALEVLRKALAAL